MTIPGSKSQEVGFWETTPLGFGRRIGRPRAARVAHWIRKDKRRNDYAVNGNGKGGHVRTISVPDWAKAGVDNWVAVAGITTGPLLRSINKAAESGEMAQPEGELGSGQRQSSILRVSVASRMTCDEHVPDSATRLAANWSRFSFCLDMFRSRQQNATWDVSSDFAMR